MSKKSMTPPPSTPTPTSEPSAGPTVATSGPMDVGLLEAMVRLMSANDLTTVDVRDGDRRVILRRGGPPAPAAAVAPQMPHAPTPVAPPPAIAADPDAGLVPIKSPMVGTFYAASGPDAKAFVSVGSAVGDDTDVCVIEAMKVFNNIKAECRGTVARVVVTNGQTVEFGQVLFLVKP